MAEARTLRGLLYFELVRRYGNVVLMTSSLDSYKDPSTFVQAEPKTVYEFIEKDLKYAIDNLPYATDDTYRSSPSYRIAKGAALGLLAKVYATWAGWPLYDESKWEQAAKTAEILIMSCCKIMNNSGKTPVMVSGILKKALLSFLSIALPQVHQAILLAVSVNGMA